MISFFLLSVRPLGGEAFFFLNVARRLPDFSPYCNVVLTTMTSGYDQPPFKAPHIEDSKKRVRVLFGGKIVVDTDKAKLVYATNP